MPEARERVTGIGGVFFRARDPEALAAWYREHLGVPVSGDGYVVFPESRDTHWVPFEQETDYWPRAKELMDTEGSSALRRAKLTRSFNNGYRSYSRTYNSCTPSAQTAISRFLTEGAEIADALMKSVP